MSLWQQATGSTSLGNSPKPPPAGLYTARLRNDLLQARLLPRACQVLFGTVQFAFPAVLGTVRTKSILIKVFLFD